MTIDYLFNLERNMLVHAMYAKKHAEKKGVFHRRNHKCLTEENRDWVHR